MRLIYLLLTFIVLHFNTSPLKAQSANEFQQIRDQIYSSFQGNIYIPYLDQNANYLLTILNNQGAYTDINYSDKSQTIWKPGDHLSRTALLAKAYSNPASSHFNSSQLLAIITQSLEYWLSLNPAPSSTNWYYYAISVPKDIGNTLICLRKSPTGISQTLENSMIQWMTKGIPITTSPSKDGSNLIDVATHYIMRASLLEDEAIMNQAVNAVSNSIEITTGEGVQADNSFRAHGPQLYMYGYGSVFLAGITSIAQYVANTSYQIAPSKIAIMSNFIRNGYIQASRGRFTDFNVYNRGISRPNSGRVEIGQIERFKTVDLAIYSNYYDNVIARMNGTQPPGSNVEPKHIHYWRSDYTVHHRPAFMMGVRAVSNRTVKAENGNGENLKGYYMTDGATYIAVNGNEYDGIYPVWDWNKLPGTTVPELTSFPLRPSWGANPGSASFVGGVSDGSYGVSTYAMNDYNTKAKKSWFFFDKEIVCLGSDISSLAPQPINTTVNQSLLDGNVTIKTNSGVQTLSNGSYTYNNNLQWVLHDSIAYFFPNNGSINLQSQAQTGTQKSINSGYSDTPITKNVFKMWFPHGTNPSKRKYAYKVVPGIPDVNALNAYNPANVEILANTDSVQAVRNLQLNMWQLVFHHRGTFSSNGVSITVDKPCLLILKNIHTTEIDVVASDPNQSEKQLLIGLQTPFIQTKKQLNLTLPTQSMSGSSVAGIINLNSDDYVDPGLEINSTVTAIADAYVHDGSNADTNFGTTIAMPIKQDEIGYNRQIYLKFNSAGIQKPVSKAILRMYVTQANTTANTTQWDLHKTSTFNWLEEEITWNNKPSVTHRISTRQGVNTQGYIDWDITQAINTLTDGEIISLRISSSQPGTSTDASMAARENSNENFHPTILIENKDVFTEERLPIADSWVRSGSHADKNYGAAGYTVVQTSGTDINNSYFKFNLKGYNKKNIDATLRLYNNTNVNANWSVKHITDSDWEEGPGNFEGNSTTGITWNNAPNDGNIITGFSGQANEGYVYFNVSSLVKSLPPDSIITLQVSSPSGVYTSFASRNNTNVNRRPSLIINSNKPEPLSEIQRFSITADAFVRGGTYATDNYGSTNVLTVKNESNNNFTREAYIKSNLTNISPFAKKFVLRIYVAYAGVTINTNYWDIYSVADNSWTETTLNWNNKPQAGDLISSNQGTASGNYIDFDITDYVISLINSGANLRTLDQMLSFKIVARTVGSTSDASFSSKESGNPNLRPLIITYGDDTPPLPVTYVGISGHRQENGSIRVSWATISEINHKHFEIERSEDGKTFSNIGTVKSPIRQQVNNDYIFDDIEFAKSYPFPLYYRIKQIDLNGHFEYSPIISVAGNQNARITFGPNPSQGQITIILPVQPSTPLDFRLVDLNGAQLMNRTLFNTKENIDLSSLPKGIYFGIITHIDGSKETLKMILN